MNNEKKNNNWCNSLFSYKDDPLTLQTTCLCPCITFGKNSEYV